MIPRTRYRGNRLIPFLFVLLAITQILDAHSTLMGNSTFETNKAIKVVSNVAGFVPTVLFVKGLMLGIVGLMYLAWKRTDGRHDREFVVCLSILLLVYSSIVINNYHLI